MARSKLLINIDDELKEELREIAKEDNRTLSNLVETVLLELVQNRKKTNYLEMKSMKDDLREVINKDTQEERLCALWDMVHKYLD